MKALRTVLAVLGISLTMSSLAVADPTLNLKISDNVGAGYDVDANAAAGTGFVNYNGAIGAWNVNVTTGLAFPSLGSTGEMDLNSVDVTNQAGAHHLTIILTQTGTSIGAGSALVDAVNALGGTSPSITWFACVESTCTPGGAHTGPPSGFSANDEMFANVGDLANFTIQIVIDIFHTGSQSSSFDSNLALLAPSLQVPEPSPLLLLGAALIVLFRVRRRSVR
jgi:hypothetical protein